MFQVFSAFMIINFFFLLSSLFTSQSFIPTAVYSFCLLFLIYSVFMVSTSQSSTLASTVLSLRNVHTQMRLVRWLLSYSFPFYDLHFNGRMMSIVLSYLSFGPILVIILPHNSSLESSN